MTDSLRRLVLAYGAERTAGRKRCALGPRRERTTNARIYPVRFPSMRSGR
jgi:hypothetical protein